MVELREITKENYEECLQLDIAESQKDFVSSTVHSLAQAWVYYDTAFPFAIYANNTMVGFRNCRKITAAIASGKSPEIQ
ncbi:hypothetical protein [uncultured Acetatifactor sp.]|uniref:hypothetical protein n=1 Tax=uncultured Acetatifactor sp. TaxID=1671927 RepID=UPI00262086A1|nr:hypothetical protein [uncultured Acetatifactor sp.]